MYRNNSFFYKLNYFIRDNKFFYFFLVGFAIMIAFFEGLNITLLYPIISMGLGTDGNISPYPHIFSFLGDILPVKSAFVGLVLVFLLLTAFLMVIQLLYWKLSYFFTMKVTVSVKYDLYSRLFSSDYQIYEEKKQGELINLVNAGPSTITGVFEVIMGLIADVSLTIIIFLSSFMISPTGLVVVIIGSLIYYFINNRICKNASISLGKLSFSSQQSEIVCINEYITGVRAITAANRRGYWEKLVKQAVFLYWDHYPKLRFLQRMPGLMMYSLFLLAIGFMTLFLSTFYHESFSAIIPVFGTFTIGLMRILPKATSIGYSYMQVIQSDPYISAVYSFLTDTRYNNVINGGMTFDYLDSGIIFDNVYFSYGDTDIIHSLSLSIHKGEITALVGPSGAGKSTITSLLMRLYDPNEGKIFINGIDLKEYDIGTFRDHIGYVGQEPFVFNSSIRDNIVFGGVYSEDEIKIAASLAHADIFINKLPDGYESVIGDHGFKLSGGEKQRIVIARAMIRKPEILILDEATASLDNISERLVQAAIDEVSKECTTIVIAHRLTTVQNADRICVLDQGRVVEEGSHTDLIERKGLYWKMYTRLQDIT
jgi:ATP-binding cassette, subfamily B, bacterial